MLGLARGIYEDRAFDRLPLLADALMDAGCDDDDVLDHCRERRAARPRVLGRGPGAGERVVAAGLRPAGMRQVRRPGPTAGPWRQASRPAGTARDLRRPNETDKPARRWASVTVTDDLYDPRSGGQAIRIDSLRLDGKPFEPARTNYFAVYLIESGSGTFWADASQFAFGPGSLLFFVPYQHVRFAPDAPVHGEVVQFHANFLCVETFHAEVGCSGVLFNDPYGVPVVMLDGQAKADVKDLIDRIRQEHDERDLAYGEVMLAHLKVLLVLATRLKSPRAGACGPGDGPPASGPGPAA